MTPKAPGRWQAAPASEIGTGCSHPPAHHGQLDESARRLSHEEHAVAALLASEGHDVVSRRESRSGGRTPDLMVCGAGVEVKSWVPVEERDGRLPTARSVRNKLVDAHDQAHFVVLYARDRGATASTVRRGLALYAAHPAGPRVTSVRAIGDGFDLSWALHPGVESGVGRSSAVARDRTGPDTPGRDAPGVDALARSPRPVRSRVSVRETTALGP
ncbi:MAG: hypothetical protein JO337_14020 [Acidimicrobiales bacterium]|nr:hypothetical protein [Acidimicrobiales bacterium]